MPGDLFAPVDHPVDTHDRKDAAVLLGESRKTWNAALEGLRKGTIALSSGAMANGAVRLVLHFPGIGDARIWTLLLSLDVRCGAG